MCAFVQHMNTFEVQFRSKHNNCFEDDKLCLLPVKEENRSGTVTCSKMKLNCLRHAQNNLMSMLKVFENRVSKLLEQCREERKTVQEHIAIRKKGETYCQKPFNCPYCPDFKFIGLFGCFSNIDTLMKKENQELNVTDLVYPRKWTEFHRCKLEEVIIAIETENKIKEANQEVENLRMILGKTEDPERKAEIKAKLRAWESVDEIFKMTPESLCTNLRKEYDWVSISYDVFRHRFTPEECRAMWHSYLHPQINKTPWTAKEKIRLKELVIEYKHQDWDSIAMELGTRRSGLQCIVNFFNQRRIVSEGRWSKQENKILKNAVSRLAVGSSIPWHVIANYLPGRSKKQIWDHWTYTLNPLIKKGAFTEEEDMLLVAAVRKYGKKFDKVAEMFRDRTSAQLRYRYTLVLEQPKKIGAKWSPQDDALLLQLVKKHGEGQWKEIADHFLRFDRTQVRHHYNVLKKRQPGTSSEDECLTDEPDDCISEKNLITDTSNLVYGTDSDVDKLKRSKLKKMLLPIKKHSQKSVSSDFNTDCFSYFMFMKSHPFPKEMKTQYENEYIESKFYWLSCALYILQARLLIPGYNNPLLCHHLLSDTDRQIISLLRDRHLVIGKEAARNDLIACETERVNVEEPVEVHSQCVSVQSEACSTTSSLIKFTMPLNHATLTGFQCLSSHCEFLKEKITADEVRHKGGAYSLFEQRLFCLFFWPALASEIEPHITDSATDAEQPKVRKRVPPSRMKKQKHPWLRREKKVDESQKMKRKYVKSGKYKKERTTEISEIRRSSRIVALDYS